MAFKTKTQQAVAEVKDLMRGLDSETRGVVISEMYNLHKELVEDEVKKIQATAFVALPSFPDNRQEAEEPKQKRKYTRRTAATENETPKRKYTRRADTTTSNRGRRKGARKAGSLFDVMLMAIDKREKEKGYADRNDILEAIQGIRDPKFSEKENYDLTAAYLHSLKKARKQVSNAKINGAEEQGKYILTNKGQERVRELKESGYKIPAAA